MKLCFQVQVDRPHAVHVGSSVCVPCMIIGGVLHAYPCVFDPLAPRIHVALQQGQIMSQNYLEYLHYELVKQVPETN